MRICAIVSLGFGLMAGSAWAGGPISTNTNNVAIDGWDVVAYFTQAKAVKGSSAHAVNHKGAIFHFATASHKKQFQQSPGRYLPSFGGYCAFAVAMKNAKVPANPQTFKLYNGKLLLFFDNLYQGKKFNTKVPWNQNERKLYKKASGNWRKLAKK